MNQTLQSPRLSIAADERIHPSIRLVARACIDVAKQQVLEENLKAAVIAKVYKLEPEALLGEHLDFETIFINNKPTIVFVRGTVACQLSGKFADWLVRNDKACWWRSPGEKLARNDWIILNCDLPVNEVLGFVEAAVVQSTM